MKLSLLRKVIKGVTVSVAERHRILLHHEPARLLRKAAENAFIHGMAAAAAACGHHEKRKHEQ